MGFQRLEEKDPSLQETESVRFLQFDYCDHVGRSESSNAMRPAGRLVKALP
jgi:hypothetical protein